LASEANTLIR